MLVHSSWHCPILCTQYRTWS